MVKTLYSILHRSLDLTTLQECLDRANKVKLKLQVYNFDDDQDYKKTPKFILGFGGIDDDALKPHVDALIKSLIIK